MVDHQPLAGLLVAVTASRKVEQQVELLRRRGAATLHVPVLALAERTPQDDVDLRAATDEVLAAPVDVLVATTGVGVRAWLAAADRDGCGDRLVAHLDASHVVARGPKTVGALRARGLREAFRASSEAMDEVTDHLLRRPLSGRRVVVQEYGVALDPLVLRLRDRGAEVVRIRPYRVARSEAIGEVRMLLDRIVDRRVAAVTFTAALAVEAMMAAAEDHGLADDVAAAFRSGVLAVGVGHVTAAAFDAWDVPVIAPARARLVAMVQALADEVAAPGSVSA